MVSLLQHEQSRLFLWIPVLIGLGILLCDADLKVTTLLAVGGIVVSVACIKYFPKGVRYILATGFFVCLGYGAMTYKIYRLDHNHVQPLMQIEKGRFSGVIESTENHRGKQRFVIELTDGRRVRLTSVDPHGLSVGSQIEFYATLMPFSKPILKDGFDFGRAAYFKGISATGRMRHVKILEQPKTSSIESLRYVISQKLYEMISGESGAIATALVTGERGRISEATRQAYADAGIAHVLAISGLHLSMIASLVFLMLRRLASFSMHLAETYDLKKVAALATVPILWGYLMISGMGVPAIRSFVMVIIVLFGVLVNRQAISMRTLAIAASLILIIFPETLTTASFALSFAAVVALVAAYEGAWGKLQRWRDGGGRWRYLVAYGLGIISSTIIATLATLPITLYVFNRISLQAILSNLVVIPLMGFMIMPLLLLSLCFMPFGGLSVINEGLAWTIQVMTTVANWTAALPGAAIQFPKPPEAFLWLSVAGGLWLCLWHTKIRYVGLVPIMMAIILLWVKPQPFYWISAEGQIYWYDGHKLSTFANSRHSDFIEEILQRQLGLTEIKYESDDLIKTEINDENVILMNEKFSWKEHRKLCQDSDVIVSRYCLPRQLSDWGINIVTK